MALNFNIKVPSILKSVKYNLAVVNGVFLLTGIVLVIIGIIVTIQFNAYGALIPDRFTNISIFVIATGALIILGSGLGAYAALSTNFYFVAGYTVLLLVVLVFEIAIIIAGFALQQDSISAIRPTMRDTLNFYDSRIEYAALWDDLQMEFECCGISGRADFISNRIPVSCCHIDYGTVSPFECTTANAHPNGCADVLGSYLAERAFMMAVTAVVFMCIQVLLCAMGGWLSWRSKFEEVDLES